MSGDQQQSFPPPFAPIQGFPPGTVLQGFVPNSLPPTSTLNLPTVAGPIPLQMPVPTHDHGFQPSHLNLPAPLPVKMPVPAHNHGIPVREPSPEMRAYRACLHCRGRKTKCDLSANGGQVPCKRCKRENRECVLGESHRGGRRERKKKTRDSSLDDSISNSVPGSPTHQEPLQQPLPQTHRPPPPLPEPFQQPVQNHQDTYQTPDLRQSHQYPEPPFGPGSRYSTPMDQISQWQSPSPVAYASPGSGSRGTNQTSPPSAGLTPFPGRVEIPLAIDPELRHREPVRESVVSADLHNPSDALSILNRVAEQDEEESLRNPTRSCSLLGGNSFTPRASSSPHGDGISYKPLKEGLVTLNVVHNLISDYERSYHPYLPIVPRETFDFHQIARISRTEPHLFSAILTVASKQNADVHRVCYDHMQKLVYNIIAGHEVGVEAVTALLLLSQWVSHEPKDKIAVGRGEEDRVSWMYIGTAVRLGYFLGIDRTAFRNDENKDDASFRRNRLVWSACYVCDRLVSVRLGKGFWARGPGPLSGLRSKDFPDLQPSNDEDDNFAEIFQANLELTQIFSNVSDILYSSKGHGWKEMLEGRYAKHLDDFRTSIRIWDETWRNLKCSPGLKDSLNLSYRYLRVYVNAFAYQATISRVLIATKDAKIRNMPLIGAETPDARFIFEAIDAAKDLLAGFNEQLSPTTLRCMPCQYYLYIIYSAVFLYKARSTTTMSDKETQEIQGMVDTTIDRLEKSSAGAINMGSRYSRLLKLLWRKNSKSPHQAYKQEQSPHSIHSILEPPHNLDASLMSTQVFGPPHFDNTIMPNLDAAGRELGFSWLDLSGAWYYVNQNYANQNGGSVGTNDMDEVMGDVGSGPNSFEVQHGTNDSNYFF